MNGVWLPVFFSVVISCAQDTTPAAAAGTANRGYVIRSGDQLDIKLYYHPDLNENVTVRPDGRIALEIAGEVMADGLAPAELQERLEALYSKELKNPAVTVLVRTFSMYKVFIDGEVGKPGVLNLPGKMTLAQAIAEAGGLRETGRANRIMVIRRDAAGKPQVLLSGALYKKQSALIDTLPLEPWDIVYVPRTKIADVNRWVDQYIRKNIPITFGILTNGFLP